MAEQDDEEGLILARLDDLESGRQPKLFRVDDALGAQCATGEPPLFVRIFEELCDTEECSTYSNTLWDGALLAAGLLRRQPWLARGRRVLEIGAGLGLPSLVAAALGGDVVASEQAPLSLLRREAERNASAVARGGGALSVRELDWEWPLDRVRASIGAAFDLVLGCDIFAGVKHGTTHYRQILCIAAAVLRDGGSALFTWVPRCGICLKSFASCVAEELPAWEWSLLDASLFDVAYLAEECGIVHLRRRAPAAALDTMD